MEFLKDIVSSFGQISSFNTFIIVLIIVLLLIPIYIFKDTISFLIKNWFSFKRPRKRVVLEARYHDIFNVIEQVKAKISAIKYTTHGDYDAAKSKLIIELICTQLEETKKSLIKLINVENIDEIDNQQLKFEVIRSLRSANERYNNSAHLRFLELGVSKDDSKFLLSEYAKFRDDVFDGFIERVESISSNDVYTTNFHRVSASFEVVAMGLHLIARDSIYTCSQINGRFKKYNEKF